MNIHLPAILGFTRYQGFDPSPSCNGQHGKWNPLGRYTMEDAYTLMMDLKFYKDVWDSQSPREQKRWWVRRG